MSKCLTEINQRLTYFMNVKKEGVTGIHQRTMHFMEVKKRLNGILQRTMHSMDVKRFHSNSLKNKTFHGYLKQHINK